MWFTDVHIHMYNVALISQMCTVSLSEQTRTL